MCDTDLITIRIWGEEKYDRSDPWIVKQTEERPYALWLLCKPDIPWVYDPQRENPHDRDRLFDVYKQTLERLGKPYVVVGGEGNLRLEKAVKAVDQMLQPH
jgi:nicotinamide riboside kinase